MRSESPAPPTGAEAPPAPPAPAPRTAPRQIVLNFDNADVEVVIQAAAEIVGFNYVLAPGARGRKVTVQTVGKISRDAAALPPSDEVLTQIVPLEFINAQDAVNLLRPFVPQEGAIAPPFGSQGVVLRLAPPSGR